MSSEARERLRDVLERHAAGEFYTRSELNDIATAVIAELYQRSDDPATYAEVAAKLYRRHDLNTIELGTAQQYMSTMLETLIGPRPDTEQEREG